MTNNITVTVSGTFGSASAYVENAAQVAQKVAELSRDFHPDQFPLSHRAKLTAKGRKAGITL